VKYACEMSRTSRVLNTVTGVFSSLFIQRKCDSELETVRLLIKNKENVWLPIEGSGFLNSEQTGRSVTFVSKMTCLY
jgi:hypothetical protein